MIENSIYTFQDESALIQIEDILNKNYSFHAHNGSILNFSNSNSSIWIKFKYVNKSATEVLIQSGNPELEYFNCFEVINNKLIHEHKTGIAQQYNQRFLKTNKLSLPIISDSCTIYLNIRSGSSLYLPLFMGSTKSIADLNHKDDLFNGAVVGIMLLLILYNLFIFLSVRDQLYIRYCIYLVFSLAMMFVLEGLHLDLLKNGPILASRHIPNIMVACTTLAAIWFSTGFLNLNKNASVFKWTNFFLIGVVITGFVFELSGDRLSANWIIQAGSGLTSLYLLIAGIWLLYKGQKTARFYVISWGVLVCCAIIYILTINGAIPFMPISINSFQLGSVLEGGLLSFALADRINQYRKEKHIAQKASIAAAQKNEQLIRTQNIRLEEQVNERTSELKLAKEKSENLLLNILPQEIADELKDKGYSTARLHEHVSVLFTDFVNFTGISEKMTAKELVQEIHQYYVGFDEIIESLGMEKIKTIGDAYLAVSGLPIPLEDHAERSVDAALAILDFVEMMKTKGGLFDLRIGIHSGPVVAGIVGIKKFAFDIWGDTVNTASRMESNSELGKINISQNTYELVKDKFLCSPRGKISAKNKGEMEMYFVNGRKK